MKILEKEMVYSKIMDNISVGKRYLNVIQKRKTS